MKVKFLRYGILVNEKGERFICDYDGYGNIISEENGDLYKVIKRDGNENIIEIENL